MEPIIELLMSLIPWSIIDFAKIQLLGKGMFGNVYFYKDDKRWAIKCLPIEEDDFREYFTRAIKEYCLFKIATAIRVGPNLGGVSLSGFDLICYQDCIEFVME